MQITPKNLRFLASEVVADLAADFDLPTTDHNALKTSVVRQWITNNGNATLFAYKAQLDLTLEIAPHGEPNVRITPGANTWIRLAMKDWKIEDDSLTDILDQLNLGQSAEASNDQGERIRLWINPRTHATGVEVLESSSKVESVDLMRPARTLVKREIVEVLNDHELETLAASLVSQWSQYDGHACVFSDKGIVRFILEPTWNGSSHIRVERQPSCIDEWFRAHGVAEPEIPGVIGRLNRNQTLILRDHRNVRSRVWHDPKAMRLRVCQE